MSERHLPKKAQEKLRIFDQLLKIPVEPPCDKCPWRLYPDKIQGCDNAGCGFMAIYIAVKYYQRAMGYWPHAGKEIETVKMLLTNATDLLNNIHKTEDQKNEQV